MNRREKLIDNYEDALFAVLMDKVAEEEGAKLREENRRLKEDPNAEVPEHVDAVARQTIRNAFAEKNRRSASRRLGRILNRVAVALCIFCLLFVTAYAAFPEVQLRTLNLLIQSSDVASKFILTKGDEDTGLSDKRSDGIIICGYSVPDLSSVGFSVADRSEDKHGGWVKLESGRGETVRISISKGGTEYIDIENLSNTEEFNNNGYVGMIYEKDNRVTITWSDPDRGFYITVVCTDLNRSFAIQTAKQIVSVEA